VINLRDHRKVYSGHCPHIPALRWPACHPPPALDPRRVRVFVAVASAGYPFGEPGESAIPLPRYREAVPAPPRDPTRPTRNAEVTLNMAIYLLDQVGGDSQSLHEEETGR
jgi:hypothetical protein